MKKKGIQSIANQEVQKVMLGSINAAPQSSKVVLPTSISEHYFNKPDVVGTIVAKKTL